MKNISNCFSAFKKTLAFAVLSIAVVSPALMADTAPFKSLNYLYSIQGKKTLGGQHNKEPNSDPLHNSAQLNLVTGKWPALHSADFLFGAADINSRQTMINEVKNQWNKGAVINLMWHACSPVLKGPCQWEGGVITRLTDEQWTDLITEGTVLNNNWKQMMDEVAVYLAQLQASGVEVLFRPLHEMNQGLFWWGGRKGPNGTSKLFQITHDYFTKTKGLNNLVWVWNLQDFSTLATDVNDYDPGSNYYDILSLDMYWSDGKGYTPEKYTAIRNKAAGKPIAIGEAEDLPSPSLFNSQPDWVFFMGWAELTFKNSSTKLNTIFGSDRVVTRDEMPGWVSAESKVIKADTYTNSDGVAKTVATDGEVTNIVSSFDAWEWMSYAPITLDIDGTYVVSYRVSSANGAKLQLEEAGAGSLGSVTIPPTGVDNWTTVYQPLTLTKGAHSFGLKVTEGSISINWFSVSVGTPVDNVASSSSSSSSASSGPTSWPLIIQAESYSNMDGVVKSTAVDGESTSVISEFDAWDWMSYSSVDIPVAGTYKIGYRVKSSADATLQFEEAGAGNYGTVAIPVSTDWTTVYQSVTLTKGAHSFGLKLTAGSTSLNWFSIECEADTCTSFSSSSSASSVPSSSSSSSTAASSVVSSSSSSTAASASSSSSGSGKKTSSGGAMDIWFLLILSILGISMLRKRT